MISYSLYLWHWPLIVFQGTNGLLAKGVTPQVAKIFLIIASIAIASLSWRFVEQPFRDHHLSLSRSLIFRTASAALALIVILGAGTVVTGGAPSRYPSAAIKVASFLENTSALTDAQYRLGSCFFTSKNSYLDFKPSICLQQDPHKPNDLLIGDSYAAQLWYGLSSTFTNINFMQATASGCKPTLDQSHKAEYRCSRLMTYAFSDYLPTHHVDRLIIAARWDVVDIGPLQQTLVWADHSGIEVLLFGPIIQYDSALPRLLAMSIKENDPGIPALHRMAFYETLDTQISKLVQSDQGVRYVSYFKMLCRKSTCLEYPGDGIPLQSDYGHLTGFGSVLVASKLRESGALN
jgi:hypothetical protein